MTKLLLARRINQSRIRQPRVGLPLAVLSVLILGCSVSSGKKHYVLAEKLWSDAKYAAAVTEFEKVVAKDPHGKLGMQALLRAASTQSFFLANYGDALKKYRVFIDANPGTDQTWDVKKQVGEILFTKTDQYEQAIQHYRKMLLERPESPEAPELLFRIGKSQFYLWQFADAVETYQGLIQKFPTSPWAEKASFETGVTHFTKGEQHPEGKGPGMEAYREAIQAYETFLKTFPKSQLVPEAKFGIANCFEELDQLDAAFRAYEQLKQTYPSRNVIEIKLARIRERKAQRSR